MEPSKTWDNLDLPCDSFMASIGYDPFAGQAAGVQSSVAYNPYAGASTEAPDQQLPIQLDETPTNTCPTNPRVAGTRRKSKTTVNRIKGSNFIPPEDTLVVMCWLEISKDSVVGTNQKGSTFWDRIVQLYNERRGTLPSRSLRSLQSRWDLIKEIVGKFIGYVIQVERANPSGYGDSNKIAMACAAYAEVEKVKFQLMHCYVLMKDEQKWMDSKHNKGPRQAEVDTQSQFTPFGEDSVQHSADDSSPTPSPGKGKRPMGREASKNKNRKISSSSSGASEFVDQLQVLSLDKEKYWKESERRTAEHNDFLMLEREKLALQRQAEERQAQLMQRAEDERILGVDLEKCPTEALRTYYATLQQEILERIKQAAANRGK